MLSQRCGNIKDMKIVEITEGKDNFKDILLIGDEDWNMVKKYLYKSRLFVLYNDGTPVSACAVFEGDEYIEIKNLATYPKFQKTGYASKLLNFVFEKYIKNTIILGTGENRETLNFYKKRGFMEFRRVKNFFTENYPEPIFENGIQLVDMVYLKRQAGGQTEA